MKYDPDENVPPEFLTLARNLASKQHVSKAEFVSLCKFAVKLIDAGQTGLYGRSHIAYHIAGLWLRHKNIDDVSLLNDIGGQFGVWDREGSFDLDDEIVNKRWSELKSWIVEADNKYSPDPKGS